MTEKDIRQMREAHCGLLGRLAILKHECLSALDALQEKERQRDELQAACDALALALKEVPNLSASSLPSHL